MCMTEFICRHTPQEMQTKRQESKLESLSATEKAKLEVS